MENKVVIVFLGILATVFLSGCGKDRGAELAKCKMSSHDLYDVGTCMRVAGYERDVSTSEMYAACAPLASAADEFCYRAVDPLQRNFDGVYARVFGR